MRRTSALALLFALCLCLVTHAADAISGTWNGSANSPEGTVPFKLSLTLSDTAVTGTLTSDMGSEAISNGKFEDETLSFSTTYNSLPVSMSAKLADGKLTGTFSVNGGEVVGDWEATRGAQ